MPPKTTSKSFPVWAWAGLAGFLVVLVAGGVLVAVQASRSNEDGWQAEKWVKMAPPGTNVSWEFPTEPDPDAKASEKLYGCVLRQSGKQSVIFLVTITHHEAHDKQFPGQTIDDIAKMAQPGGGTVFGQHLRKYDLQGRTANLFKHQITEKVILLVTEPGKTYRFEAFGPGVDENNVMVKRFLESVKFG